MRFHLKVLCVLLAATGLLVACGKKGPLYLPKEEPEEKEKQTMLLIEGTVRRV